MKRILSLALAFAMLLTCTAFTAASAESSDTLVVLPYMTSENLNPYAGFSIDKVVRTQLFNSLWQYDENGQGVACLAESWEDSEDGTSITVHLRQDVTFSDGTPFNADAVVFTYDIAANSAALGYTTQSVISGGNQQKVILARELESDPDVLIAVHPTRGLDIGATRFVHDQMIAARDRGVGILLISADFDEILEMSDRILVIFEGQIMGEYSGKNPPIEEISLAMTGK